MIILEGDRGCTTSSITLKFITELENNLNKQNFIFFFYTFSDQLSKNWSTLC